MKPGDDPDEDQTLEDLCESPELSVPERQEKLAPLPQIITNKYYPFENAATFILFHWQNNGNITKSDDEMNRLARELSSTPEVTLWDLRGYNAKRTRVHLESGMSNKCYE